MFLLFSFLCFKQKDVVDSAVYFPGSFGFLKNGSYNFDFAFSNYSNQNDQFYIFFLTKPEYRKVTVLNSANFSSCNYFHSAKNLSFNINNSTKNINGTISDKETYIIEFLYCSHPHKYAYTLSFKNPNTFLDSREIPCLTIYPISMALSAILLVSWVAYHFYKKRMHGTMYWISCSAVLTYIFHLLFEYIALSVESKKDTGNSAEYFSKFIDVLNDSYFISIIILISTGYGYVDIKLKKEDIAFIVVLPLALFSLSAISNYTSAGMTGFFYICIFILGCTIIYHIYKFVKTSEKKVMAHMLVVSRRGIDPESTPLKEKLANFHKILLYAGTAALCVFMSSILSVCIDVDRYSAEIVDFILHMVLLVGLLLMYQPKAIPHENVDVGGDQETFDLDDLDNVSSNLRAMKPEEQMKWEPGTPLPREPKFTKQHKATNNQTYSPLE